MIFHGPTSCVSFDYVIKDEMIKIFWSEISLSPQIVYCPVILTIMKFPPIFMNFFSSQVTINLEIMENLQSKNFMSSWKKQNILYSETSIVLTNCVLLSHPTNYEASKDFHKFFVLSSNSQSWNHGKPTIEKLYVIYRNRKQARSEGKL